MLKPDPDLPGPKAASVTPRQRRWHSRVFTGCVSCRRRHVKCDEATPSCSNCKRLNLPCTFDRKFVFKSVKPTATTTTATTTSTPSPRLEDGLHASAAPRRASSLSGSASSGDDGADDASSTATGIERAQTDVVIREGTWPPSTGGKRQAPTVITFVSENFGLAQGNYSFSATAAAAAAAGDHGLYTRPNHTHRFVSDLPSGGLSTRDDVYLHHFLNTVSSYLIVFDTPSNSNPYRQLPSLMGNSGLLRDAMKALGAMHMSGLPDTQNRQLHHSAAMKAYGNVVTKLRGTVASGQGQPTLELLATTLLLCMFEKMASHDASWKIHLVGAAQIFHSLYSPRVSPRSSKASGRTDDAELQGVATSLPLRRFLVSLMAYLDVAASVATGEGPLIAGDYWETFGGGWEYNLGVPSFAQSRSRADRTMAQIRQSWSRIMSIQTDLSQFVKVEREGLSPQQRDMYYNDLVHRLQNWQDSTPDIYLRLDQLDAMPPDATPEEHEILTAISCIQTYALACFVYLDRVMCRSVGSAATNASVAAAVDRILTLTFNFQSGINQLGVLWPLLTAGIATVNPVQQNHIRERLASMRAFGFRVSHPLPRVYKSPCRVRLGKECVP